MTAGGWLALAWAAAVTVAAAGLRAWQKRRAGDHPVPGADQAIAITRPPGVQPRAEFPRPASIPTFDEQQRLGALARARVAALPGSIQAAQVIADGLRLRFPAIDDTTLGLVTLELFGYAHALAIGLPDPALAMRSTVDALGLTAEELTRLARQEIPR